MAGTSEFCNSATNIRSESNDEKPAALFRDSFDVSCKHGQELMNDNKNAAKAGMSLRTARAMKQKKAREHRTRLAPFAEVWEHIKNLLESKTRLEQNHPGQFSAGLLRPLQRRVRDWRVLEGPERKEVMFLQDIQPYS